MNWKDLGYEDYKEYLCSTHWKEISQNMKEAMNNKCEICKETKNIEVHHISYVNASNESSKDLVVLCSKCHKEAHKTNNDNIKKIIKRMLEW
jgi:5-methylcytosine-specific restriction endonuclease McrA